MISGGWAIAVIAPKVRMATRIRRTTPSAYFFTCILMVFSVALP